MLCEPTRKCPQQAGANSLVKDVCVQLEKIDPRNTITASPFGCVGATGQVMHNFILNRSRHTLDARATTDWRCGHKTRKGEEEDINRHTIRASPLSLFLCLLSSSEREDAHDQYTLGLVDLKSPRLSHRQSIAHTAYTAHILLPLRTGCVAPFRVAILLVPLPHHLLN